jgi:hypothetical protein
MKTLGSAHPRSFLVLAVLLAASSPTTFAATIAASGTQFIGESYNAEGIA